MSGGEPELTVLRTAPTWKSCAACGEEFSCGAPASGCWCEELQIAREVLSELRARYTDCLCRQCLSSAATASSAQRAARSDSESRSAGRNILPQHLL
jgi:hypothetical protein